MKKILSCIIALLVPTLFLMQTASAGTNDSTITYQRIDGVYFYLKNNTTGAVDTNHVTKFFMNGQIAYCIEPMIDINDKVYNSTNDWNIINLSNEQKNYIEMVGYFGYEYPGHQNDRYWLAAQQLIWEKVNSNVSVKFTTGANGTGSVIDLSKEKNQILNLVNNYNEKPSFSDVKIEGNMGDTVTVTDSNNVLSEYNFSYNGKHKVTKNGNNLTIEFANNEINEESITFKKSNYDSKTTILYYQNQSQKLASLRISNPSQFELKIKSNGGKVEINKIGEKVNYNNNGFSYEKIKLDNVVFGIYANEDIKDSNENVIYEKYSLIDTIITDENGIAELENLLFGKYFLMEFESSHDNMVNKERYYFEINENDLVDGKIVKKINFNNFLPKGTLEFSKIDVTTGEAIPNTQIEIYTENDELVFSGKTDENGNVIIEKLPAGKYYIIETNPADGYVISNEKVLFEIKEDGQIVKAQMTNKKITGELEFTKIDLTTGEPLENAVIEIYTENDELVFSGKTDENGNIIVKNLKYGKYYIVEKKAPEGYELSEEKIWFEIEADGQIVKAQMTNKPIVVDVPNTESNYYHIVEVICGVLILCGLGAIFYVKKKRKKDK